ncbi:MAG TPA: sporulation membrane protein YtaF [Firmicutes bacterium]|nr:sporulation membrane protein YtaF [Bacillota bacterium]
MDELSALVLALAVSLDSLGVGFAYGAKKVRIPPVSLFLLSGLSMAAMYSSMLAGRVLAGLLPAASSRWLGGAILIGMGLSSFFTAWRSQRKKTGEDKLLSLRIRPLGLIIQVIEEPGRADLDDSGEISSGEAVLLGAALALDALGAGLGAALTAFPPFITSALVGGATLCTLKVGQGLGQRLLRLETSWATLAHGALLVALGFYRLL